ncbi:MAG: hypothetical protein ACTSSK_17020 [Candidatus Heimdallarchaeota archaeon]
MIEEEYVEEELVYEEEDEEEDAYQEDEYEDKQRKILTFGLIILISFSLGCSVVGFSMLSSENSARKDLANNAFYLSDITNSFDVTVQNTTSLTSSSYKYIQNSNLSTFENVSGEVVFTDDRTDMEYMVISFPPSAPEMSIQLITFHINEKSQLNIIIFADGIEVYNAMKIKNDITINFSPYAVEISVYVF